MVSRKTHVSTSCHVVVAFYRLSLPFFRQNGFSWLAFASHYLYNNECCLKRNLFSISVPPEAHNCSSANKSSRGQTASKSFSSISDSFVIFHHLLIEMQRSKWNTKHTLFISLNSVSNKFLKFQSSESGAHVLKNDSSSQAHALIDISM